MPMILKSLFKRNKGISSTHELDVVGQVCNCIICVTKPATIITGHLIRINKPHPVKFDHVLAGFCEEHGHWSGLNISNEYGCYGYWHEALGLKECTRYAG